MRPLLILCTAVILAFSCSNEGSTENNDGSYKNGSGAPSQSNGEHGNGDVKASGSSSGGSGSIEVLVRNTAVSELQSFTIKDPDNSVIASEALIQPGYRMTLSLNRDVEYRVSSCPTTACSDGTLQLTCVNGTTVPKTSNPHISVSTINRENCEVR